MPAAPLISVVIPCFNQGHYLREAVRSLGTPGRATEVLVVDDGSTDDTREVAERCAREFRDRFSLRLLSQPNAGVSNARNRGLRESTGTYVVFLDADDHLSGDGLETGARTLDAHPEAAFAYGRCQMMTADGTLLPTPIEPRIERRHYQELLRRNFIWTPANVMYRRTPLERSGGFNPLVSASADYELYLRLARTNPVVDHGHVIAHYRRHGASMSGSASRMLRETLMVLRSQWPYVEGDAEAVAAYRDGWRKWQEFYGDQLATEIRSHVRAGEVVQASKKTVVFAALHPKGLCRHAHRKIELTVRGLFRPRPSVETGTR